MAEKKEHSALHVVEGVPEPSSVNDKLGKRSKKKVTLEALASGILAQDISSLSRGITLIESTKLEDKKLARALLEKLEKPSGKKSLRIGITGVPGVGKSSFIEALGNYLINTHGLKLAVLAIDPSSQISKGSILGDKTRMETLSRNPNAFIRPSPSSLTLGGVARKTRETMTLCEAFGFDVIFVETVGVGQSETVVASMTDFFLLLMLAGAGDELQGIKRGIMEMADLVVIHKADGDNQVKANLAKTEYTSALHLLTPPPSGWTPLAMTASSYTFDGIPEIWNTVSEFFEFVRKNGFLEKKRKLQSLESFQEFFLEELKTQFFQSKENLQKYQSALKQIELGELNPFHAVEMLFPFQKP